MELLHVTSWYKIVLVRKQISVKSAKFSRKRSTRSEPFLVLIESCISEQVIASAILSQAWLGIGVISYVKGLAYGDW